MQYTYLFIAIQLLFLFIIQRIIYRRFFHPLHIYPGPFLASITNIWKFHHYLSGTLHLTESHLHTIHGPILRTGPNTLSFSSPSAFESIYSYNHGFEKGDFYSFARDPESGKSNIFSARTHVEHRERRRNVVGSALKGEFIRSYIPIISKHVKNFVSRVEGERSSGKVVNIAEVVHAFTFNTLLEIIYGPNFSPGDGKPWTETPSGEGILGAFKEISKFGWGVSYVPFLGWLMNTRPIVKMVRKPTFNKQGIETGINALSTRAKVLLFQNPELVTGIKQDSIAKNMLRSGMSKEDVFAECFNLLFAGPGSTAAAITGVLERLGRIEGKRWQDGIRDELSKGEESSVLEAVIRESLRYSAPFPTAFPRDIRSGAEMAIVGLKRSLPVGTLVGSNTWIVGRDEGVWGEDAGVWKPERWLVDKEKEKKKGMDDKLLVFSKGSRGCVGKEIAMLMVMKAVEGIVSRWRIESVGEMKSGAWLEMQIEWCGLKLTKI